LALAVAVEVVMVEEVLPLVPAHQRNQELLIRVVVAVVVLLMTEETQQAGQAVLAS
jgi:hypothetical protein